MGEIVHAYGNNCILYADIVFKKPVTTTTSTTTPIATTTELTTDNSTTDNSTTDSSTIGDITTRRLSRTYDEVYPIDIKNTEWGSYRICSFCQYTQILSMIFALCWITFFIMCGAGGAGYPSDLYKIILYFSF